jgi:hypothetical protein
MRVRALAVALVVGALIAGCGSGSTQTAPAPVTQACRPNQLALVFGEPQGATGAMAIPAGVSIHKGPPCKLNATAAFSIRQNGILAKSIQGNPASWHIRALLHPGGFSGRPVLRVFAWQNWCGKPHGFEFVLKVRGITATSTAPRSPDAPPCNGPGSPSTLRRLPGSP